MPTLKKSKEEMWSDSVTKAFKVALLEKKWTVTHFAKLLGKEKGYVSRVICHPLKVDLRVLLQFADKLDIKLLNV